MSAAITMNRAKHWELVATEEQEALTSKVEARAKEIRRAITKNRLDRAQAALEALEPLPLAMLLRETRETLEAAEECGDVPTWEFHAAACLVLLVECDRRNGHPDETYTGFLERFETELDAGTLGPNFGALPLTRAERRTLAGHILMADRRR